MDTITLSRNDRVIGRVFLGDKIGDGLVRGFRFDIPGEPKVRRELKAAIETNTENVRIRGGTMPRSLSLFAEGIIGAVQAVADRLGLVVAVELTTKGLFTYDEEKEGAVH